MSQEARKILRICDVFDEEQERLGEKMILKLSHQSKKYSTQFQSIV